MIVRRERVKITTVKMWQLKTDSTEPKQIKKQVAKAYRCQACNNAYKGKDECGYVKNAKQSFETKYITSYIHIFTLNYHAIWQCSVRMKMFFISKQYQVIY